MPRSKPNAKVPQVRATPLAIDLMTDRLDQQFGFLNEADRLKSVLRATTLCDGSRRENSAEHSWHLTLYALEGFYAEIWRSRGEADILFIHVFQKPAGLGDYLRLVQLPAGL